MVRKGAALGLLLVSLMMTDSALAQEVRWTHERPDGHAPAGVMADFLLRNRELYVGVRVYQDQFRGTRLGTEPFLSDDVLDFFAVAPLTLDRETAEVEFRLGLSDFITLQASMPFSRTAMFGTTDAAFFETASETMGDVSVRGLFNFLEMGEHRVSLTVGGTIPTGQISRSDATPFAPSQTLPYAMQGGSGTFDILAGISFLTQNEVASVGAQVNSVIRVHDNDRGYRLGDRFSFSVWGAHNLGDWVSVSMRGLYETWGDVRGSDPGTDGSIDPGADPFAQGGERIQIPFGANLFFRAGPITGHRLSLE